MTEEELVTKAKARALEHVNKNRADRGLDPLTELAPLWWEKYGESWLEDTAEEE